MPSRGYDPEPTGLAIGRWLAPRSYAPPPQLKLGPAALKGST